MKSVNARAMCGIVAGLAVAFTARADEIFVGDVNGPDGVPGGGDDCPSCTIPAIIDGSMTWTADNTYNLQMQIYVTDGATLTIEPGTIIASTPTVNGAGSLAITRGCKIIAQGTGDNPIIFTSTNDDFVTWRAVANEWGNLTIMGDAYVGNDGVNANSGIPGNSKTCGNNVADMEGLATGPATDRYGGTNDDDDSGTLEYVSFRYGGRVVGLANELNGLSLGGIGRATDINHLEIMNNVDDGVEIWGGTVNLKHVSIWNIGDDSFDIDQGWRGKVQFMLIVQGYSLDAAQGSGIGDNCFETDGAEDSDAQPRTRAAVYNATVLGQPIVGDRGAAFRDGAGVQYRQCIFMDLGERLINNDNSDGDGSNGYAFNGTESFAGLWTTPYTTTPAVNECVGMEGAIYQAQSAGDGSIGQGFASEMTDSVFFRNLAADAYNNSNTLGVTVAGDDAPAKGNVVPTYNAGSPDDNMPIAALTRIFADLVNGDQLRVTSIDPRARNDAVSSVSTPPSDGFYAAGADYRGAFAPNKNWLIGWTAADAYGLVAAPTKPGDVDGDGATNVTDLLALLAAWGACPGCPADINDDGAVNVTDLLAQLADWGM